MSARRRCVPSVLAALALAGASLVAPVAAHAASSSLSGTVTDPDGSPLADICVDVLQVGGEFDEEPSETPGEFTDRTDALGAWSVDGLPAGEFVVAFNLCGDDRQTGFASEYYDDATSFTAAEEIALTGTSARTGIDASLALSGAIAGRITDDVTGADVSGVCVSASGEQGDSFGDARTDSSGAYRIPGLSPGGHEVSFRDCSAPFTYLEEVFDDVKVGRAGLEGTPTSVAVTSGATTTADAALTQGGAVTGTVTGAHTGKPQLLVCVGLHGTEDPSDDPVTGTVSGVTPGDEGFAPDGSYVVPGVPAGRYAVAFADPLCEDDGYTTVWYDDRATEAEATPITVVTGETVEGIDAVVTPRPSTSFVCPGGDQPDEERQFPDVAADNTHRASILCMSRLEVLRGKADGTYAPAELVRRGQLATLVVGLLDAAGVPVPVDPADAFDDDEGHVHEKAIDQVAELGVLGGKGGRRFDPEGTVDRGQIATVMVAAYREITGVALLRPAEGFSDDGESVHEANIERSALAGFTAGKTATRFEPFGLVPRDALATFLARGLDRTTRDTLGAPLSEEPTEAQRTAASSARSTAGVTRQRYPAAR